MFSSFSNIFFNKPRETESTDARLGIRQHEIDKDGGRKKEKEDTDQLHFNTEDSATVTVEALRVFLENFLKSLEQQDKNKPQTTAISTPDKSPAVTGESARAAGAYQNAARTSPATTEIQQQPAEEIVVTPIESLPSEDIRKIHALLANLTILVEKKIEYITIERSDSFLNSLTEAVEKAIN